MMTRSTMMISMLALVALLFVGCAKTPEQRVTGTWGLDVDATLAVMAEGEEEATEEEIAETRTVLEGMAMSMTFNADGTAAMTMTFGETHTEEGTWSVKSAEGDTVTIEMTTGEGEEADTDELILNFTGNNTVAMEFMNDEIVFARQ